jgi:ribonuclease PH
METLAQHSLSQDFSSKTSGGARIPRDALGTAQDTSLLSSGGSLCAPAAFLDETYLSHRLYEALSPAVILKDNSKMCVEVFVEVLQSDGGVFNAAVLGASLALVDAGVAMRDMVCAGSAAVMKVETTTTATTDATQVGKRVTAKKMDSSHHHVVIADPTEEEILQASGVLTIALMPNWKEVTVWDQFGKMSMDSSSEAIELARDGCVTMHKFLKNCLLNGAGGSISARRLEKANELSKVGSTKCWTD